MRKIKFGDIKIGEVARNHIKEALDKNWPSGGDKVKQFEKEFAELFKVKHSVAVSSGTDAVLCACMSLYDMGAKPGDYVIVPALSFIATSNAVRAAGFVPLFVDINRFTLNIDLDLVEKRIQQVGRQYIAGIIAVTTMGKPIDGTRLREISNTHKITSIIDNAEGHGCTHKDRFMEEYADMVTYSFYAAHMICSGEGGAVNTNRDDLKNSLISVRSHGRRDGQLYFDHCRFGLNSKMNDLEASIGLEGIGLFDETFKERRYILESLIGLANENLSNFVYVNSEIKGEVIAPHAFSMTIKQPEVYSRDDFYNYLMKSGIDTKINFGCIPTQQSSFSYLGYRKGDFPEAEYAGKNGLHVGSHQYMTIEDVDYIIDMAERYFEGG